MAMFNKTSKIIIDDTEDLTCFVENAQNINKHTEYTLRVQRGLSKENKWTVSRRYRDFAALQAELQQSNIELPLPPKKLIGNMQPSFVAERQIALQNYINEVLKHKILALTLHVRSFLDPKNYPQSISEQALQTVSIALRGEGRYELKTPLPFIGWRIRKHYFLVTDVESCNNCMLSWQSYGPDRSLCDKDLQAAFKSLHNLSHPFIDPVLAIHNLETGAYVVRRIHETGSLRDILYGTDYTKNHLAKYGKPKIRKPFTLGQISHYGYQLLLVLKFLHEKGLPHGHIHPGNIAIENQRVLLMDIENVLVGVASRARPLLVRGRRPLAAEAADVYGFGRTIYEMAFAEPLEQTYWNEDLDDVPEDLAAVLRLTVSPSAGRRGAGSPCVAQLLQLPLFARAPLGGLSAPDCARPTLKFPVALKEELKRVYAVLDGRLKVDHKLVQDAKKEVRIQKILNSEEELKKHKRRAKKRDSIWKSTSSLAETVRSQSISTASSPTPPALSAETSVGGATPAASSPCNGRAALLGAICAFDKTRLARVASR